MTKLRTLAGLAAVLALSGCTSLSADGRYGEVRALAQSRTAQELPATAPGSGAVDQQVADLLAKPLTPESAVTIALLNNRSLQADYAELGIAEADLVQAGRLPNPGLSFSRLKGADGLEIERKLTLPLIGLLTMPVTRALEQRRYEQAQLRAAGDLLRVADATRRAWFKAVAAQQGAEYFEQVASAAEAGAELAKRGAEAGNWSKLQQAREQAFHADAIAQLTRATRFVNLLDLGYRRDSGGSGYEIELQIPLFDWGGARVAKAETLYMQAVHRAAGAAVDARSQVRETHAAYRSAYDIARHYRDEIVPLKKRISDEQLLRYNGMLISVFELLADARDQVTSVNAAIEAQRDFWIADAALQAALTGNGASQH